MHSLLMCHITIGNMTSCKGWIIPSFNWYKCNKKTIIAMQTERLTE